MLLSDAIRLGAMLNRQGWLWLKNWELPDGKGACETCALGGAMDAVGVDTDGIDPIAAMEAVFPKLKEDFLPTLYELSRVTVDHEMPMSPDTLIGYISCLNDTGYYSREWIADWLVESGNDCESVEISIETPAAELAHTTA